ncbi:hypothetical protein KPH14_003177 [Odynerus spinipes]|uniref:RanBD1 domain-containing protein n=1 Tax=Odynerus spinipes TaxID=1348599 RepID=A0AAD9RXM1_9HYME|nr:hypothetical protein KPH14_003177 [Odynerus spinipes]
MATKRAATTELNHENWNEEREPEDAGTFGKASDEVLQKRVIKAARRRLAPTDETSKGAFGGFTGFKTATTSASASPFSFLASMSNTFTSTSPSVSNTNSGITKSPENGTGKTENVPQIKSSLPENDKDRAEQENEKSPKKSSEYFAQLKGLNESVAQWIKTHVDSNPFCILTPIYKDYEKYLNEIELKYGNESTKSKHAEQTPSGTDATKGNNSKDSSNKTESDSASSSSLSTKANIGISDWKQEKSIFGNVSTNTKSIFDAKSSGKSIFDKPSSEKNPLLTKPNLGSEVKEGDSESKSDKICTSLSFTSSSTATFSFGQSSTTTSSSAGFSFGNTKPFSFGTQVVKPQDNEEKTESEAKEDEDDEPPKPDFKPVTEEGAIYEQRCKVFIKKDGTFSDRGIGTLFLKPTPNEKMQLIVRAENTLGNLLINTLLTKSIPTQRMNKNTIMMVCLPDSQPPPTPVLLRVKTSEDADVLLETLDKHKK